MKIGLLKKRKNLQQNRFGYKRNKCFVLYLYFVLKELRGRGTEKWREEFEFAKFCSTIRKGGHGLYI